MWSDFVWWRDPKGYGFKAPKEPNHTGHLTCVGKEREPYSPFAGTDAQQLPREFVRINDAVSYLAFVNRYGPLTRPGLQMIGEWPKPIEIIRSAGHMYRLMFADRKGDERLYNALGDEGAPLGNIDVRLVRDPATRKARLRFSIPDLRTAIWLRFSEGLSSGIVWRQCLYDGMPFECGPGTPRRLDSTKFCSPEHRTAYNNLPEQRAKRPGVRPQHSKKGK